MDALVTYCGNRVGYSAVRSLAGLGIEVAGADTKKTGMGQWSRFCRKSYTYAHPLKNPDAFVEDILSILEDSGAHFLMPGQHDVEVLSLNRERLPSRVVLPLPSYESIRLANDKARVTELAAEVGVPVPDTIRWDGWKDLKRKLGEFEGELVVKLRRGHSSRGVFFPGSRDEAVGLCKGLAARYSLGPDKMPVVQERVSGQKWMVSCIYWEGRKLASFTQRVLREKPLTGGVSTLRVSEQDSRLEGYAERLLDRLGWHGIAMVEFKRDPVTGKSWLIEINPRLWGAASHSAAAGADMVSMLYVAATKGPARALEMARPYRKGMVSRWWLGDAQLAVSEAGRLRLGRALRLILPGEEDVYDDFRLDDPGASAGLLALCASGLFKGGMKASGLEDWEIK